MDELEVVEPVVVQEPVVIETTSAGQGPVVDESELPVPQSVQLQSN